MISLVYFLQGKEPSIKLPIILYGKEGNYGG